MKHMIDNVCEKFKNRTAFIVKENKAQIKISYEKLHSDVVKLANGIHEKNFPIHILPFPEKTHITGLFLLSLFFTAETF